MYRLWGGIQTLVTCVGVVCGAAIGCTNLEPNVFVVKMFFSCFFFFNDTATTEIYTLSLHDALPILQYAAKDGHMTTPKGSNLNVLERGQF